MGKVTLKKQQAVSFAGHSWLGLSRESLAKSSLSWTLQILACASHMACFLGQQLWVSREQVVKSTSSQILHQTLTHIPYIKSHKNTGKWLNRITIKFDTELKPTQNIVVNHIFTEFYETLIFLSFNHIFLYTIGAFDVYLFSFSRWNNNHSYTTISVTKLDNIKRPG